MNWFYAIALAAFLSVGPTGLVASEFSDLGEATPLSGNQAKALILSDFIRFDPHYVEQSESMRRRLDQLGRRLRELQETGNDMECSNEIYLEAKWLAGYTANWDRLEHRLNDLAISLAKSDQEFAIRQSPETGLWGACYEQPFFKLEATALALIQLQAVGETPAFAIHLPAPFESRASAFEHFGSLIVSDIAKTGIDNRGELGNIATVASLAYFKAYLNSYLEDVKGLPRNDFGSGGRAREYQLDFYQHIRAWQDPVSGYWGPWYRSDGHLYKTADLSFTFHIISYRRGQVDHWPEIIATTFAIENDPYPFGWKHEGELDNHNNYDVAKILRYAWPYMSAEEKRRGADAIETMLDWTLTSSLRANGSFETTPAHFSSVGADFYFGVSFLENIGFWDPAKRFWTDQKFPEAQAVCKRIKARLVAMALKSSEFKTALARLEEAC